MTDTVCICNHESWEYTQELSPRANHDVTCRCEVCGKEVTFPYRSRGVVDFIIKHEYSKHLQMIVSRAWVAQNYGDPRDN